MEPLTLSRRTLNLAAIRLSSVAALALPPACAAEARESEMRVWRDAGCGCCHVWVERMSQSGRFRVTMTDEPNMAGLKRRLGVPGDLASCRTGQVDGYVIEGHVPTVDILRLLSERPNGVRGLAVPGMAIGSPGMEAADGRRDPFEVIAFGDNGMRRVFAHHT